MNVVRKSTPKSPKSPGLSGRINSGSHATKLNLYQTIPKMEVSLDEFEEYALARLKVCGENVVRSEEYDKLGRDTGFASIHYVSLTPQLT